MGVCTSRFSWLLQMLKTILTRSHQQKSDLTPKPTDDFAPIEHEEVMKHKKVMKTPKKEVPRKELTEELLQEYLRLEREIRKLEAKELLKNSEVKAHEADEMMKTLAQLKANHKELVKKTEKEHSDLINLEQPSIKAFLKQQGTFESRYAKEKAEYIQALEKQEIAEKELMVVRKGYEKAQKISDLYREWVERLEGFHQGQDEILGSILGSEYTDLKEVQDLETAMEWRQRVEMAKFKWINGRALLVHASAQLNFGILRWKELSTIEPDNARTRYFTAAEARSNFVAGAQNVQSCRVYLERVQFPYATEEEMLTLETALQNAFNDIQSNAIVKKTLTVCQGTYKKVHSLVQWFDKVINETIIKDLEKANGNVVKRQKHLREKRWELMGKEVRGKLGKELEMPAETTNDEGTDELEKQIYVIENAPAEEEQHQALPDENIENPAEKGTKSPQSSSEEQLAPIPSMEAIFGF